MLWLGIAGFAEIELVKAVNIWRVEERRVRRMLLLPAIGRAAGEKEH